MNRWTTLSNYHCLTLFSLQATKPNQVGALRRPCRERCSLCLPRMATTQDLILFVSECHALASGQPASHKHWCSTTPKNESPAMEYNKLSSYQVRKPPSHPRGETQQQKRLGAASIWLPLLQVRRLHHTQGRSSSAARTWTSRKQSTRFGKFTGRWLSEQACRCDLDWNSALSFLPSSLPLAQPIFY